METASSATTDAPAAETSRSNSIQDSSRSQRSTKPPSGMAAAGHHPHLSRCDQLRTAQLLFEPQPPARGKSRTAHSASPSVRRRAFSAKAPTTKQSKASHDGRSATPGATERRPLSAVLPGEKIHHSTTSRHKRAVAGSEKPKRTHVTKQFLEFEDTQPQVDRATVTKQVHSRQSQGSGGDQRSARPWSGKHEHHLKTGESDTFQMLQEDQGGGQAAPESALPKGIAALASWLTPGIPADWIGVDPESCLVFLPSLRSQTECLPVVPPPQASDDLLPHKPAPPAPKPFDPRKLFHYNVEKNLPAHMKGESAVRPKSRPGTGRRGRIYSLDGQLLHDQSKYSKNRTIQTIEQELADLEMLLTGVGREGSANIVVQYQHEINLLKQATSETIIKCRLLRRPKPKVEEPPDLTGLRAYIREREGVLVTIRARREECLAELRQVEESLGMSSQWQPNAV
ncbi:uncharacterized protein [Diadema antillarum]|uniref:uncharacterized protein n=1 Tax=Diadema antillarum TaxID=105358 RepID=UPI003A83CE87